MRLSQKDIELTNLPGWNIINGKLHKKLQFESFSQAFGFMTRAFIEIGKINHRPEWFNVDNKITIELTTHDSGGITKIDVQLAKILNSLE